MIKRLSVLLSILCLCAPDVGWATSKTSQPVGNIYYLRADGTATNKAAATFGTSAATAMSVATHNAQTFAAGDTIYLCDTGGTFKASIIAPSSGADGNSIIYAAAPGQSPIIDLSYDMGTSSGWTGPVSGVYSKAYGLAWRPRVVWEDGVALKFATSAACDGPGSWYYENGSRVLNYYPTTGSPGDHTSLSLIQCENANWNPYAFDLRERSNIDASGLTINRGSIGVAQNVVSSASTIIKNIKIHGCTINYSLWAIWGQVFLNSCIFQDAEFYNNTINYSNSGISIWTNSDETSHTQCPLRVNIHHNTINHHCSIDATHNWTYAIGGVFDDHEAISFQDSVDCIVSNNQITSDSFSWGDHTRAIFLYLNPNAPSMDGNKVTYNRINGTFTEAILFMGNIPNAAEGNIIAYNVLQGTIGSITDSYGMWIGIPSNSASGINYICNNTINYNKDTGTSLPGGIFITRPNSGKWTMENNIITTPRWVAMVGTVTTKTDCVFSNNNYYSPAESPLYYNDNSLTFSTWQGAPYNWDTSGSYLGIDPVLRASDSALTTLSPTAVKSGGTPIEGITVISGVGQLGIDGKSFDPKHPSMGAYAQPVGYR